MKRNTSSIVVVLAIITKTIRFNDVGQCIGETMKEKTKKEGILLIVSYSTILGESTSDNGSPTLNTLVQLINSLEGWTSSTAFCE